MIFLFIDFCLRPFTDLREVADWRPTEDMASVLCFCDLLFSLSFCFFSLDAFLFVSSSFFIFIFCVFLWHGLCAVWAEVEAATSPNGCLSLLLLALAVLHGPHVPDGLQGCHSPCGRWGPGDLDEESWPGCHQDGKAPVHQPAQGSLVCCPPQVPSCFFKNQEKLN